MSQNNDKDDLLDLDSVFGKNPATLVAKNLGNPPQEKLPPVEGMSMLDHIEMILKLCEETGLDDTCLKKAMPYMEALAARLHVTPLQAALFAHFVARGDDEDIRLHEVQSTLLCNAVRMLKYQREFDALVERKILVENHQRRRMKIKSYAVPENVNEALRTDTDIKIVKPKPLDISGFFDEIERIFECCCDNDWEIEYLAKELKKMLTRGAELSFSKAIKGYHLHDCNLALLFLFCHLHVNKDDADIDMGDVKHYFCKGSDFRWAKSALVRQDCALFSQGLVENTNDSGFGNREKFQLTAKAKEELLGELDMNLENAKMKRGLILCKDIAEKKMYYNPREEKLVDKLCSLLQPESFKSVQERLKAKNMRTGFACLFYGKPGTGKTETVNMLARKTGRDIMLVDIAETKSCWFGESEKRIKKVFDRYRAFVKVNEPAPILLFNEADAVIGKRRTLGAEQNGPGQTENAIQNIILQEMETLDGILIATTNLTQNLDSAFERRFLYKIEFDKPSLEARTAIWKIQIPELSDADAKTLAEQFDFLGGQIENIARKRAVDSIIEGSGVSLETLTGYCKDEKLDREHRPSLGFQRPG